MLVLEIKSKYYSKLWQKLPEEIKAFTNFTVFSQNKLATLILLLLLS